MEPRIEQDIPVPAPRQDFSAIAQLEVDQSVAYPSDQYKHVGGIIQHYQRQTGRRFTQRTTDGVVRVWRVS